MQLDIHRSIGPANGEKKTSLAGDNQSSSVAPRANYLNDSFQVHPPKDVYSTLLSSLSEESTVPSPVLASNVKNIDPSSFNTLSNPDVSRLSLLANPFKSAATANLSQSTLRYSPSNGLVPLNPTTREAQSSSRRHDVRPFSSTATSNRELAGRNGVRIDQSFKDFFSYQVPPLVPPEFTQKPDHSSRSSKPSEPVPSKPAARHALPSEPFNPPKETKRLSKAEQKRRGLERRGGVRSPPPTIVEKPPQPTSLYIGRASAEPQQLAIPQRLLLVLDLNGTLLWRKKKSSFTKLRFNLSSFLNYCFEYHDVMIWSSARPFSVERMCNDIFSKAQLAKLVAVWARDTLGLSPEDYAEKVQVYKRLDRIWDNQHIQAKHPQYDTGGGWDQSNTLLIDDSTLKASAHPWNHVEIPEFLVEQGYDAREKQLQVFSKVAGFLHDLRKYDDVSRCLHKRALDISGPCGGSLRLKAHEDRLNTGGWAASLNHGVMFEEP